MNERIRELADKAGRYRSHNGGINGGPNPALLHGDENIEKFAELIVRECLDIVGNNNPCPPGTTIMYSLLQDEYFDKGWQVAVEIKSNQIKKHFGVGE